MFMDESLKTELSLIEATIKETLSWKSNKDEHDLYMAVLNLSGKEKNLLRFLLKRRKNILDRLLLCTQAEISRLKEVNDRLLFLTNSLYQKTYSLYTTLLEKGYDPAFDDDIMIEGTLMYIADSWEDSESVLSMNEDKEYGSDFRFMMTLISDLNGDKLLYPCARTMISYNQKHSPTMSMKELGLDNSIDDGQSWDHIGLFKDICVCHAIYSLRNDNLYSYPDILRMNDFWCEVKVTHQLLTDLKGTRYSLIED